MQTFPVDKIHNVVCHECKSLNAGIVADILQFLDDPATHKTHFFNGRYENIYIKAEQIPSIEPILKMILQESAKLLDTSEESLQLGFWINFMQKDDVTTAHRHDDDDELLSGTYYLQMPEHSGSLKIKHDPGSSITIKPEEASLTCFHPTVEHEVSKHLSPIPRVSIGFNIGYKKDAVPD